MNYQEQLAAAVRHFWITRAAQHRRQEQGSGKRDIGARSAVTAGKHLDGFVALLSNLVKEAGLSDASIHTRLTTLPGYFRPTKDWDLVIVADGQLLATVELKAQVGSFGNNFNNRVEEAIGNAVDLLTAFREGKFKPSSRPWLGWLMLLEASPKSIKPVRVSEPHFAVFPEFKETSYAQRYALFCERLIRERLYDATCLILSDEARGLHGEYAEPVPELGFKRFATSLLSHVLAYVKMRDE